MTVLKRFGKVYGAQLTTDERRAMRIEIQKELAEFTRKHENEIDALFLWWLHDKLGYGPKRLRDAYEDFSNAINDMRIRYLVEEGDEVWFCTKLLKNYGVDIEKWNEEKEKGESEENE